MTELLISSSILAPCSLIVNEAMCCSGEAYFAWLRAVSARPTFAFSQITGNELDEYCEITTIDTNAGISAAFKRFVGQLPWIAVSYIFFPPKVVRQGTECPLTFQ